MFMLLMLLDDGWGPSINYSLWISSNPNNLRCDQDTGTDTLSMPDDDMIRSRDLDWNPRATYSPMLNAEVSSFCADTHLQLFAIV